MPALFGSGGPIWGPMSAFVGSSGPISWVEGICGPISDEDGSCGPIFAPLPASDDEGEDPGEVPLSLCLDFFSCFEDRLLLFSDLCFFFFSLDLCFFLSLLFLLLLSTFAILCIDFFVYIYIYTL